MKLTVLCFFADRLTLVSATADKDRRQSKNQDKRTDRWKNGCNRKKRAAKKVSREVIRMEYLNTLIASATASTTNEIGNKNDNDQHGKASTNNNRNQIGILLVIRFTDFFYRAEIVNRCADILKTHIETYPQRGYRTGRSHRQTVELADSLVRSMWWRRCQFC